MKGRLEAQINTAASIIVTDDSANSETITFSSAYNFYISSDDGHPSNYDLFAFMEADANDGGGIGGAGDTISFSISSITGKVTITFSGSSGAVNWNSQTAFRDMLGFTQGNLSGAASYTGAVACKAVWFPTCDYQADYGRKAGWQEDDDQVLVSPRGDVFELSGSSRTVNQLRWPAVTAARALAEYETYTNESFQSFRDNALRAQVSCLTGKYRFYPDETDDTTYYSYRGGRGQQYKPAAVRQNWTGLYAVELGPMYRDPDE